MHPEWSKQYPKIENDPAIPVTTSLLSSMSRIAKLIRVSILAVSVVSLVPSPASADIRACREMKPPQTEAEAVSRSGFAFDGVVAGGRAVRDPTTGRELLVSPLTFRVIRSIKGRVLDYGQRTSSGAILIEVWDAEYSLRSLKSKVERHRGPDVRISGELATVREARWRIYALNQAGNWTATSCLGSHPLRDPIRSIRSGSKSLTVRIPLIVGLAGLVAIGLLVGWRTLHYRRAP
jgi:hypothetical protein